MNEQIRLGGAERAEVTVDEATIDSVFAELDQCHLPGAAVGIAVGGRPVYRKGFGLANMELPVLLSPTARMRIGSTTKHFTSLAYMLLCEEGKARIDDHVGTYLPELHPSAHAITVRQLMTHISGLRDVYDIVYQLNGIEAEVSSAELLQLYAGIEDVNTAPGRVWMYNNGGYLILSAIIERIAGLPLEEVLKKRIFEPVGMADTLLRRVDTDFVSNSASLHMSAAGGGFEKRHLGSDASGGGAMVSTVDDMLRWLAHMDSPQVGSTETWRMMRSPQSLSNGAPTDYGLGLMLDHYRGVQTVGHPGGVLGGNSQMLKVPSAGLDVVVMLNRGDASAILLTEQILNACLPNLEPIPSANQSSVCLYGNYWSPTTGRLVQLFEKQGEQMAAVDGMDMPFSLVEEGVLRPTGAWRYQKYEVRVANGAGEPATLSFSDFGTVDTLVRLQSELKGERRNIEGCFASRATETKVVVARIGDQARLTTRGRFGSVAYRLDPITDAIFRARPIKESFLGGIVAFAPDASSFTFSTFRTSRLRFERRA